MKSPVCAVAVAFVLATGLQADVEITETHEFTVDRDARISLENINGGISIRGGNGDRVVLVARKKAASQQYLDGLIIQIEAEPDLLRIETRHPKSGDSWFSWGKSRRGSVSYDLEVPADVRLDVISTVNGQVRILGVHGPVEAETVNGSLVLESLRSSARLNTVNGRIEAHFERVGEGQRIDVRTVNGRIELSLPDDSSARVTAEALNGAIDADDFGLKAKKGFVGRDLSGDIGPGAARISVDTVNGAISLRKTP